MIYTIQVDNYSDVAVASTEAEIMGIPFTDNANKTFDVVIVDEWKLDYFLSKIGHANIIKGVTNELSRGL